MDLEEIGGRLALRELVYEYGRVIDDRDYLRIPEIFTEDAELEGPGFGYRGHAELEAGLRLIEQFSATFHAVHNQQVAIAGNEAKGETYCVASHLYERDGTTRKMDMGIRYADAYRREDGRWRIARRVLDVVFQQDLPLQG